MQDFFMPKAPGLSPLWSKMTIKSAHKKALAFGAEKQATGRSQRG
jgi:hypothetical protein